MSKNVRITTDLKSPVEPGRYFRLVCMTGPNKGKVYYLLGKRIVVGRGDEVDIQIVDTKISREHAEFSQVNQSYAVTDLGAQNPIIVNDTKVKQKVLEDGEKIIIGQTVFKFNIIEVKTSLLIIENEKLENATISPKKNNVPIKAAENLADESNEHSASKSGGSRMLIIGVVIAGVMFVLFDGEKKVPTPIRKELSAVDIEEGAINLSKKSNMDDVDTKKKIQSYIHSGRREFREENYFRPLEEFRLALLLDPNNSEASFYQSKAKQKIDDEIQKNFNKGKQEHESKKLKAAVVSYCAIIQLIQNYPNDERYKDAMTQLSSLESEMGLEKGEIKCIEEKPTGPKD